MTSSTHCLRSHTQTLQGEERHVVIDSHCAETGLWGAGVPHGPRQPSGVTCGCGVAPSTLLSPASSQSMGTGSCHPSVWALVLWEWCRKQLLPRPSAAACNLFTNGFISAWLIDFEPTCFDYQWAEIAPDHTRPHSLLLLLSCTSGAAAGHSGAKCGEAQHS